MDSAMKKNKTYRIKSNIIQPMVTIKKNDKNSIAYKDGVKK